MYTSKYYVTKEVGPVFIIEVVYADNVTAITSTMWNVAYASTKQNYIV